MRTSSRSTASRARRRRRATLGTIACAADRDGLENLVVTVIGAVAALGSTEIVAGAAPAVALEVAAGA